MTSVRGGRLGMAGLAVLSIAILAAVGVAALCGPVKSADLHPLCLASGGSRMSVIDGAASAAVNPGGIAWSDGFSAQFLFGIAPATGSSVQLSAQYTVPDGLSVAASIERRREDLVIDAAFALAPSVSVTSGLGVSYDSALGDKGFTATLGIQYRTPILHAGIHVRKLSIDLLDGVGHVEAAVSAVLPLREIVGLAVGLTTADGRYELGVGAEILLFGVRLRWGGAVDLAGGFSRIGAGIGFALGPFAIDAAAGIVGGELLLSVTARPVGASTSIAEEPSSAR